MTHWHDPAVLAADERSSVLFVSWLSTYVALLGSYFCQVFTRYGWRIYVSYIHLSFR